MSQRKEWRLGPNTLEDDVEVGKYLRSVVRVFPDYADTVIWFAPGPVDYETTRISADLVTRMTAWEDEYYRSLDDDVEWISRDLAVRHADEGLVLARELSDQLGDAFEVEVWGPDDEYRIRLLGQEPGTNPEAVNAFRQIAAGAAAREARFTSPNTDGRGLGLGGP